jgi:hypothetical protein
MRDPLAPTLSGFSKMGSPHPKAIHSCPNLRWCSGQVIHLLRQHLPDLGSGQEFSLELPRCDHRRLAADLRPYPTVLCDHGQSRGSPLHERSWAVHLARMTDCIEGKGNGGGGEIRTHGTLTRTTVFETVPIGHSGTPPQGPSLRVWPLKGADNSGPPGASQALVKPLAARDKPPDSPSAAGLAGAVRLHLWRPTPVRPNVRIRRGTALDPAMA